MQSESSSVSSSKIGSDFSRRSSDLQSLGSGSSTSRGRLIGVGVEGHKNLESAPFAYVFTNLIERTNCRVLVFCCMSQLVDEMGFVHAADVKGFGGLSQRKVNAHANQLMRNLDHFLREFRVELELKGVVLEHKIIVGPRSEVALVGAAKKYNVSWLVLDRAFANRLNAFKTGLECSLVLMTNSRPPGQGNIIRLNTSLLGPVEQIEQNSSADDPEPIVETPDRTSTSSFPSLNRYVVTSDETVTTNHIGRDSTEKNISCFNCWCSMPTKHSPEPGPPGPTMDTAVVYGESEGTYVIPTGTIMSSPRAGGSANRLNATGSGSTSRTSRRSVKLIERQLEATRSISIEEVDDPAYQMML